jgi:hypothetical protein
MQKHGLQGIDEKRKEYEQISAPSQSNGLTPHVQGV